MPLGAPNPGGGNGGGATVNTAGLMNILENNVLPLGVLVIAILIVFKAHKRNVGDSATMVLIVCLGLLVAGLAVSSNLLNIGSTMVHWVVS